MREREPPLPSQKKHGKDLQGERVIRRVLRYPFRQAWRAFQYVDGAYLRGHPELELFPTEQQRRRAIRRAVSKFLWGRAFWWAMTKTMVLAASLVLLFAALGAALRTWYPFSPRAVLPWTPVALGLLIVISVFLGNRWLSRSMPRLLRCELLDCGVPICVACGYPLFELPGPACPECGTPFDERVRQILALDVAPSRRGAADGNADPDNKRREPTVPPPQSL
jgi:hypothetical protein